MEVITPAMGRPAPMGAPPAMAPPRRHHADAAPEPLSTNEYARRIHFWVRLAVVTWLGGMVLSAGSAAYFIGRASRNAAAVKTSAYNACVQNPDTTLSQCALLYGQ